MDFLSNIQRLQQSNSSSSSSSSSSSPLLPIPPALLTTTNRSSNNNNPLLSTVTNTMETNNGVPSISSPSANLLQLLNPSGSTVPKPLLSPSSSSTTAPSKNSAAVLSMLSSSSLGGTVSPIKSTVTGTKGMSLLNQYRPRSSSDQLGEGRLCIYDINQDKDKEITPQTTRVTSFDTKPSRAKNGKLACSGQYFKAYNVKEIVRIIPHTDANIRSTVSHTGQEIADIACANLSSTTASVTRTPVNPQDVFATADSAGNVYVTVVALTSGPERQARVTVANILTPTAPEDSNIVFIPTYIRWHPTLTAHLFINRGRNIWLIDLNAYGVPASVFGVDDSADNGLIENGSSSSSSSTGNNQLSSGTYPSWINSTAKNITLSLNNALITVPYIVHDWDVCSREAPLGSADQVGWDSGDYLLSILDTVQGTVYNYIGSNAREPVTPWNTLLLSTMGPASCTYQSLRLLRSEITLPSTGNTVRYSVYSIVVLSNTLPGLVLHTLPTDSNTRTLALPSSETYENYAVTRTWYNHFLRIENGFDTSNHDLHLSCLNLSILNQGSLIMIGDRSSSQLITVQVFPPTSLDNTDRWDNRWKYAHALHKDTTVPIYCMHLTLPYIEARMQELENIETNNNSSKTYNNDASLAEKYDLVEVLVIQLGSISVLRLPYHDLVIDNNDSIGNNGNATDSSSSITNTIITVSPIVDKATPSPAPVPAPAPVTIPTLLTPVRVTPALVPTVTANVPLLIPSASPNTTNVSSGQTTTTTNTLSSTVVIPTVRPSVGSKDETNTNITGNKSTVNEVNGSSTQANVETTSSMLQEIRSLATTMHTDAKERETKLHTEFTSLLQAISGSLRTEIPVSLQSVVTEAVHEQTQLIGEVLDASYSNLATRISSEISPVVTTTVENAMKTQSGNMQASLKSLPKTLSTDIVTNLKPMATEAFKTAFTEVLLPSFERGIANMIGQITTRMDTNVTLLTEKLQSSIDTNTNNIHQLTNAINNLQQVSAQLPTINVLIDNQKGLVQDTRNTLTTLAQVTSSVDAQRLTMNSEVTGLRNDIRSLHEQMNALQSFMRSNAGNNTSNGMNYATNPVPAHTGYPPGVVPPPHAPQHHAQLLSPHSQHVNQPMYTQPQYYYGPPVNATQSGGYPQSLYSQPPQQPSQPLVVSAPAPAPSSIVVVPPPSTSTVPSTTANVSPSSSSSQQPPVASPLHALLNAANTTRNNANTTGGPVVNLHSILNSSSSGTTGAAPSNATNTSATSSTASATLLSATTPATVSSVSSETLPSIIPSIFPNNPYYQVNTLPKALPQPIPMDDKEKLINTKLINGAVTDALQEAIEVSTSGPVAYMVKWLSANPNKQHYNSMESYIKTIGPFFRLCLLQRLGVLINTSTCGSTVNDNEIIVRIDWLLMVYKVMKDVEDSSKDNEVASHWKGICDQLKIDILSCSSSRTGNGSVTARCNYFLNNVTK